MHIICPHCTTSFAIDPRAIGSDGRTVRCARCKGTWFALPADAVEPQPALAMAGDAAAPPPAPPPAAAKAAQTGEPAGPEAIPHVESPSIAHDPTEAADAAADPAVIDAVATAAPRTPPTRRSRSPRKTTARRGRITTVSRRAWMLPAACAVMALMAVSLIVWRTDIVRVLPQTAPFFKALGLDVNLRGLALRDVSAGTATVDGQSVLIVQGRIDSVARHSVSLPRLHFSVRDAKGHQLYTWTAALEQPSLAPGETTPFRARLATPPADGRDVEVRFLTRRDLGA